MAQTTPLMEQYRRIKKEHQDKILFFRMGDFFEMFDKDAEIAAPILNIALTYRNKKSSTKTKMCGLPHHSIAQPVSKLLAHGLCIAICDQLERPTGRGLVKRAVTRILSPGMVYDLETLDQLSANYMCAFDAHSISFLDTSTGSAFYYEILNSSEMFKLLEQFQPSELVVSPLQKEKYSQSPAFQPFAMSIFDKILSSHSPLLKKYMPYPRSVQRLLSCVISRQGEDHLKFVNTFEKRSLNQEMYYSKQLYSHLEVFKNYDHSSKDTLFSTINRTKTACGARLLKKRLQSPLIHRNKIESRLDKIEYWIKKASSLDPIRKLLAQMGDGERKLGKIVQPNCNAKELLALAEWLNCGLSVSKLIFTKKRFEDLNLSAKPSDSSSFHTSAEPKEKINPLSKELQTASDLKNKINHIISPSCSKTLKEGGFINKGVNPQLDEWINITKSSQTYLLEMEKREQRKLSIPSLKIRYNNVFGYYIEIRKLYSSKVPSNYNRKQTLVHAERYTTQELHTLEEKILSARAKMLEMERQIFQDLRSEILEKLPMLLNFCKILSKLDVYTSLAFLAIENNYARPHFTDRIKLIASRHPVLERKTFHEFVPNTVEMLKSQTLILTGPNMAGKSTLMRQVALTVLLAQSACFIPAEKAELPIFHKMFTRIGASDSLSQGLSTFMVEMKETAEILEKADEKSLIILDEIGRGTATFDGMSLAQSILEFLTLNKKPFLLSSTHYEELTKMANHHPAAIQNASMAIREEKGNIHFVYRLKKGPAHKSYGIQVAKLAGLPSSVVNRAKQLLQHHESSKKIKNQKPDTKVKKTSSPEKTLNKSTSSHSQSTEEQLPIEPFFS